MINLKLHEFIRFLDRRTKIQFIVNSFEKFTQFEGDVGSFLNSYHYQVFSTERICELGTINKSVIDSTLRIVVTTATE